MIYSEEQLITVLKNSNKHKGLIHMLSTMFECYSYDAIGLYNNLNKEANLTVENVIDNNLYQLYECWLRLYKKDLVYPNYDKVEQFDFKNRKIKDIFQTNLILERNGIKHRVPYRHNYRYKNVLSWLLDEVNPPYKYAESDFKNNCKEIINNGELYTI